MKLAKIAVMFFCVYSTFAAITDREEWDKRFYNFTGPFLTEPSGGAPAPISVYRDGEFLIGGSFTNLADTPLLNLARWDGATWTKPFAAESSADDQAGEIHIDFGSPIDLVNGIHSIATREVNPQGAVEVLIGGSGMTNAGGVTIANVAWWTGLQWDSMAGGTTGLVSTVLFDDNGGKVVGGNFTSIGGITATNVARYAGATWEPLGDGLPFVPEALVFHNGQLHAAGQAPDGTQALLLRWNGTEWLPVGIAFHGPASPRIFTLMARPEGLYVGGTFTNIGGIAAANIALWTGTEWQSLGDGLRIRVASLAVHQGDIIAAGRFSAPGLARWDGTKWNFDDSTPVRIGKTVAVSGEKILARGQVNTGLEDVLNGAAYFNGDSWKSLGQGLAPGGLQIGSHPLVHFVSDEHGVSLAGTFRRENRGKIRRWNGSAWEPIGERLRFPAVIDAVELQGDRYWVGSTSPQWLTPAATRIAAIGETNWTGAAQGFTVSDIIVAGTKLFAGGYFGPTGLFERDGGQFSRIESYTNMMLSLATDGNNLYVAGRSPARSTVSRFDGQTWTELASITNTAPRFEIEFVHGSLYLYGGFTTIAGSPINRIGRWDGKQWQPVIPDSITMDVLALAGDGRDSLYVGGFQSGSRTNLYQVRGGTIVPVESPAAVEALHWWRGALYVAGQFTSIQTVPSRTIAAWHDSEAAVEVILSAPTNAVNGTEAELTLHVANLRTNALSNVQLSMPLAPGATPVNLSPSMSVRGTNLVWQLPTLESGLTNLNASLRLQGIAGTNFTFEVWASGPGIPTFRSSPAWTTLAALAEFHLDVLGRNADGSWRLSWSGDSAADWIVEKSHDLVAWEIQPTERREGQPENEFTIPASSESHTFWRIRLATLPP